MRSDGPGTGPPSSPLDARVMDVEAAEIRVGDDLFGAGIITSTVWVGGSVRVEYGGTGATFWPDEVVTVRRA